MYLKTIGAIIIFASSCYMGKLLANRFAKRYSQLIDFQIIVQFFETEICYTSTPVMDILNALIPNLKSPYDKILSQVLFRMTSYGYEPLSNIWQDELEKNRNYLYLEQEDVDILLYFGNILGTTDVENQKKYFTVIKDRLRIQLNVAQENKSKYIKLYSQLGFIFGLFMIIIII